MAERVKALAAFAEDPSTDSKGHQKAAPNCLRLQLILGDPTPMSTLASAGTAHRGESTDVFLQLYHMLTATQAG